MANKTQEQLRIERGLQCPECYGAQIDGFHTPYIARVSRFECRDCGCTWTPASKILAA